MKMQRSSYMVLAMVWVCGFSFLADAQIDPEMLKDLDSFKEVWKQAKAWEPPKGIYVKWEEDLYPDPQYSEADLAAMAKRVEGHPDHPERIILETQRRRRKNGKDVIIHEVWYNKPGNFRNSYSQSWSDLPDEDQNGYYDIVVTDHVKWSLIPTQLTIIDPQSVPPRRDLASIWSDFMHYAHLALFGNIGSGLVLPVETSYDGHSWTAKVGGDPKYATSQYHGVYSSEAQGVLVETVTDIDAPEKYKNTIGDTMAFSDWTFDPVFDRWMAHTIEQRDAHGNLTKSLHLLESRTLNDDEFATVTAVPSVSQDEPLRGPLHFKTVMDFRPNKEATTIQIGNTKQVVPIPRDQLGRPPARWMRKVGWIVVGLIVVVLITMRVIRARSL